MNLRDSSEIVDVGNRGNIALDRKVRITVSNTSPSGGGSRDVRVLLNDRARDLDGHPLIDFSSSLTYDTYDGQNTAIEKEWYALEFEHPVTFNCVEMTTGFAYPDGGWWTSLALEVKLERDGAWLPVEPLTISPPYDFSDKRGQRHPYETYALLVPDTTAWAVRLIGTPGGSAQFTSLARIGMYHRDLTQWSPHDLPLPPVPFLFKLISPEVIFELSQNLMKFSGLTIGFPLAMYYWDEAHFNQYLNWVRRNYEGDPDLWFLVNDTRGWTDFTSLSWSLVASPTMAKEPHSFHRMNGLFTTTVAPVVIDGEMIGSMSIEGIIEQDSFDLEQHRATARELGISWKRYQRALARSPQLTREQIDGVAGLMGMIANTVANLVHRNRFLEQELQDLRLTIRQRDRYRQEIVRRAAEFMRENLENDVTIPDVARAVALSTAHLNRLFVEETERSPGVFLTELKLDRAKTYLLHPQMTVTDVSVALGFHPSYFSRLFKQHTGTTPGEYASKARAGTHPR